MFLRLLLIAALALPALASADELTPAKRADIRKLLSLIGVASIAGQFAAASGETLFKSLKSSNPQTPDRAREVIHKELAALFVEKMGAPDGLLDRTVPVYDKAFTHPEIKELLAFYGSKIGQKAMAVLPKVSAEMMNIGRQWADSFLPEIEKRLDAAFKREKLMAGG
jgi:hypothetical protein